MTYTERKRKDIPWKDLLSAARWACLTHELADDDGNVSRLGSTGLIHSKAMAALKAVVDRCGDIKVVYSSAVTEGVTDDVR